MARLACSKFALIAFAALGTSCLWAQDGLEGALSRANIGTAFGPTLAVADFDNDHALDGAVLVPAGRSQTAFRVEVHLSGQDNTTLTFESTESQHAVSAVDVDDDGDLDVLVHRSFTGEPLHVWLNDGYGEFLDGNVEDIPFPTPTRERFREPQWPLHQTLLSLPSQRGSEAVLLPRGHYLYLSLIHI